MDLFVIRRQQNMGCMIIQSLLGAEENRHGKEAAALDACDFAPVAADDPAGL